MRDAARDAESCHHGAGRRGRRAGPCRRRRRRSRTSRSRRRSAAGLGVRCSVATTRGWAGTGGSSPRSQTAAVTTADGDDDQRGRERRAPACSTAPAAERAGGRAAAATSRSAASRSCSCSLVDEVVAHVPVLRRSAARPRLTRLRTTDSERRQRPRDLVVVALVDHPGAGPRRAGRARARRAARTRRPPSASDSIRARSASSSVEPLHPQPLAGARLRVAAALRVRELVHRDPEQPRRRRAGRGAGSGAAPRARRRTSPRSGRRRAQGRACGGRGSRAGPRRGGR